MNLIRLTLYATFISLISMASIAANIQFQSLDMYDGLPFNSVRAIVQDKSGYTWFATELGLAKYDGYSFTTYYPDEGDNQSIAGSYIISLEIDDKGDLWAGSEKGLSLYHKDSDSFSVFKHIKGQGSSLSGNHIRALHYYQNNMLLIATDKGLDFINTKTNLITPVKLNLPASLSLPENKIRTLQSTPDGVIYIGTNQGLIQFDIKKNQSNLVELKSAEQPVVRSLAVGHSGELWVGSYEGLFKYQPSQNVVSRIQLKDNIKYILSLLVDANNNLWVGTFEQGLFYLSDNKLTNFKTDKSDKFSLSDNFILSLLQDQFNKIWIGTANSGVNSFNPEVLAMGSHNNTLNSYFCLPSTDIRSASAIDNQNVMIGTLSGLSILNLKSKSCETFQSKKSDNTSLINNEVYSIKKSQDNHYWIGTTGGLNQFNPTTKQFKRYNNALNNSDVYDINIQEQSIIIGTDSGLYKLNQSNQQIEIIKSFDKNVQTALIYNIAGDKNGLLWAASSKGLLTINEQQDQFKLFSFEDEYLNNKPIKNIVLDDDNNLWLAIDNVGLLAFNPDSGLLTPLAKDIQQQLSTISVAGLYSDTKDNLWLATLNSGILIINPERNKITHYHVSNGLHSELFNINAFTEFPDGKVLFGGQTGFNLFSPEQQKTESIPPVVSISKLTRSGETVLVGKTYDNFSIKAHISKLKSIELTHKDSLFGFEFIATHNSDPRQLKYYFKLDGLEEDWNMTNAQNRGVTYNRLTPGDYVFRLKAQSADGTWSKRDTSLKITVQPAPWLTWWAFLIYIISILAMITFFIKRRTHLLQHRAIELQKEVKLRTNELVTEKEKVEQLLSRKNEEFANISHEFRTPLTLILGPISQVLDSLKTTKDQTNNNRLLTVQRNTHRLMRMVDQLLNLETFRVKSLTRRSAQPIGKIINLISQSFQDLAAQKNIRFEIGNIDDISFSFTPDALEKILLNLLSNAIKYTPSGGRIKIETWRDPENLLSIKVCDSGIGIPQDKTDYIFERYSRILNANSELIPGAGIGLALVKQLVSTHQGHIIVESQLNKGTTMTVVLPIIDEVSSTELEAQYKEDLITTELVSLAEQNYKKIPIREKETDYLSKLPLALIVEDNPDMSRYVSSSICDEYQIITAFNGKDGVNLAINEVPDIVISDIMMPEMDGYQLTQALRENKITCHIPILLLTARSDKESRLKGWIQNADEYLTKPFDVDELKIRLKNLREIRTILKRRFAESVFQKLAQVNQDKFFVKAASNLVDKKTSVNASKEESKGLSSAEHYLNTANENFTLQLNQVLSNIYTQHSVSVALIAKHMAMSERQLFRKLKNVLDMTPIEYLRRYRLEKSKNVLAEGKTTSFTAFEVGFSSQSYFSKCFKAQFGLSPKQYKKSCASS